MQSKKFWLRHLPQLEKDQVLYGSIPILLESQPFEPKAEPSIYLAQTRAVPH